MKKISFFFGALGLVLSQQLCAQTMVKGLIAADGYISEPAKLSNQADAQGHALMRKTFKAEPFKVPKNWRLVSVVAEPKINTTSQDYVLFFQDAQGAVHSVGVQMSGALSGKNVLYIPAE